ncbi:MAG: prepilin-type N-terminal cleavage/methylation domain-containing protein [Planctomycetota bacterium]
MRKRDYALRHLRIGGFTMAELLVVLVVVSLFVLMAQIRLFGLLRKNTFKAQVQEFVATMQMAVSAAAETGRRYEVTIDLDEQSYTLREYTVPELQADEPEEEIIIQNNFAENCRVVHVLFDDLTETDEQYRVANFRVGRTGWQSGGKIVLLDIRDGESGEWQPYSVVVGRLSRIVRLEKGDVQLLRPKTRNELPF